VTLTRGAIIALLAALAIVAGGATVSPAFAQPVPTESDIQFERDSAKSDRAFAAGRLDKARERRSLAEQARKNARDARNAADRNGWNRRAREHDGRADALEEEAAGLIAEAERKEAKAGRLQERLNAATQVDERRRAVAEADERRLREARERKAERRRGAVKLELEDAIGVWKIDEMDGIFVIVYEEPDLPGQAYKLEAHTQARVWKGTYTPFEEGDIRRMQNARLVFRYKPTFEEMNPDIPEWARRSIEGDLEWEIELDAPKRCGAPELVGHFFPGEVKWREKAEDGDKSAKVTGRGEPRNLTLSLQEFEPEDAFVSTAIRIRPPSIGRKDNESDELLPSLSIQKFEPEDVLVSRAIRIRPPGIGGKDNESDELLPSLFIQKFEPEDASVSTAIPVRPPGIGGKDNESDELLPFAPLRVLVEKQLFHVDVSLPYELAEKQGEKLTLKLRGLSSGNIETVELLRGAFRRGRPAKYTNYRPLFFGDSTPFLSQRWQNEIGDHAQKIDLDLENGESVAIGFDKTFEVIPVYADMEEYTVARYMEAANFLEKLHRVRLVMPGAPKKDREDAHVRLRRLKNFQILMNKSENPKWLRVLIAEEYLGPVEEASQVINNPKKIYGKGQIRTSNLNARARMKGTIEDMWSNELNEWERVGDNDRQSRFDDIIWSNQYERLRVTELVGNAWRERVREAFDSFMVDLAFGFYEWALSEMSVGYGRFRIGVLDLFALTGDIDHYGRKLPKGAKIEIIGNLFLSHLTDYAGDELRDNLLDGISGYQAPGDKLLTMRDIAQTLRGRNIQRQKVKLKRPPGSPKNPKLPKSLSKKKIEIAAPILGANKKSIDLSKPVSCAVAPPRTKSSPSASSQGEDSMDKALTVAKRYGIDALIDSNPPTKGSPQEFGTCQVRAVLAGAGVEMNDIAVLRLLAENSKKFANKMKGISEEQHPLVRGFNEEEAHMLAGILGRESISLPNGRLLTMKHLRSLKENGDWSIKIVINARDYTDGDDKHSLDIVGFKNDPDGCGLLVTVYDSDLHRRVTMPAKELKDRLANYPVMLHRAKKGKSGKVVQPGIQVSTTEKPPRVGSKNKHFNPDSDDNYERPPVIITPVDKQYTREEALRIIAELGPKEKAGELKGISDSVKLLDARMSIRTLDQLTADAKNRPSWIPGRNMTLHDLVKQMPKEDTNMPIHVTTTAVLFEVAGERKWDISNGPSFGHGGTISDTMREGNVAIRVKKGHEGFVQFEDDKRGNRGMVPFYWPSGKHNEGVRNNSIIPTEHLEYLDPGKGPDQERWRDFPG